MFLKLACLCYIVHSAVCTDCPETLFVSFPREDLCPKGYNCYKFVSGIYLASTVEDKYKNPTRTVYKSLGKDSNDKHLYIFYWPSNSAWMISGNPLAAGRWAKAMSHIDKYCGDYIGDRCPHHIQRWQVTTEDPDADQGHTDACHVASRKERVGTMYCDDECATKNLVAGDSKILPCGPSRSGGTQVHPLELSKGIDVTTGDPQAAVFDTEYVSHTIIEQEKEHISGLTFATASYQEVTEMVQTSHGLDFGAHAKAKAANAKGRATFGRTETMKRAKTTTKKHSKQFSWTYGMYSIAEAQLRSANDLKFMPDFKETVRALTAGSKFSDFKLLFQQYGTHVATQANIGGMIQSFASIDRCAASLQSGTTVSTCHRISLMGLLSKMGMGALSAVGGSVATETCTEESDKALYTSFAQQASFEYLYIGGDTQMFTCGDKSTQWLRYKSSVTMKNADVFVTQLRPIWELFKSAGATDMAVVEAAETHFYEYLKQYTEEIPDDSGVTCEVSPAVDGHAPGIASIVVFWVVRMGLMQ